MNLKKIVTLLTVFAFCFCNTGSIISPDFISDLHASAELYDIAYSEENWKTELK